jgi:succinate dehydrogenase/fumarate reductase cytochrome b subunit
MQTILSIALAIIVLYFLFEIVVGVRVLFYVIRRKNDPIRSRLSHLLGEDA